MFGGLVDFEDNAVFDFPGFCAGAVGEFDVEVVGIGEVFDLHGLRLPTDDEAIRCLRRGGFSQKCLRRWLPSECRCRDR